MSGTDPGDDGIRDVLDLLDYRRRVAAIYAEVRARGVSETTWQWWRDSRDELFATHPASPIPYAERSAFAGVPVFPYDPGLRLGELPIHPAEPYALEIAHSGDGTTLAHRFGAVAWEFDDVAYRVSVFWLDAYGGGLFLPFRDATNGDTTYGGGRYLLDTVKSADLGGSGGRIEIDLNFAYHPSCVHDATWSCPLAPADERLAIAITGGERLTDQPVETASVEIAT